MVGRYRRFGLVLLVLALVVAIGSCAKKTVPVQTGAGGMTGAGTGAPAGGTAMGMDESKWRELGLFTEPERREFLQKAEAFENEDVYFDYDAYVLVNDAKRVLDSKAAFLSRYPKVTAVIEGHCDERGTNEYNLALGERRANSAWQYMVNSGVDQNRLSTISYGEERPLATGQDEASMAKNRRAHFDLRY